MSCIKDKHPYNLWFCLAWSVVLGLFLGAADLPGAYARAHSFLIIMLELAGGVLFLTFFSQLKTRNAEGEVKLWSFSSAGMCSWLLLTIPIAVITFTQAKDSVDWGIPAGTRSEEDPGEVIDPAPIFATSTVVASLIFTWFCYESFKLCSKMKPDEYMKGVIYFYTDMFYVCACCALLACLGGGGGQGAPPKDEEER